MSKTRSQHKVSLSDLPDFIKDNTPAGYAAVVAVVVKTSNHNNHYVKLPLDMDLDTFSGHAATLESLFHTDDKLDVAIVPTASIPVLWFEIGDQGAF